MEIGSASALLVGTYQRLLLHTPKKEYNLHSGHGPYWGVTWGEDRFYVGIRCHEGRVGNNAMQVYGRNLKLKKVHPLPGVNQMHQIFYWDGYVYIANTDFDTVVKWKPNGRQEVVYKASNARRDTKHVNSVWCDGKNFYVCEHTGRPSRVRKFDLGWKLLKTWGIGREIHNVYIEGGKLYVNSSHYNGIIIRDLETGKDRKITAAGKWGWSPPEVGKSFRKVAYTRGLARTRDSFFVGLSAVLPRDERYRGPSAVLEFDGNMEFRRKIEFQRTGGLYDVRSMGQLDRAHNRIPAPWDGVTMLEEKPPKDGPEITMIYEGSDSAPFSIRGESSKIVYFRVERGKPLRVRTIDEAFLLDHGFKRT